jgi:hypothetical protein
MDDPEDSIPGNSQDSIAEMENGFEMFLLKICKQEEEENRLTCERTGKTVSTKKNKCYCFLKICFYI